MSFVSFIEEKEPEYADMTDDRGLRFFDFPEEFVLKSGETLPEVRVAYETWGTLNAERSNGILLHCGLSASSHACSTPQNPEHGWWEEFIGPGLALDTDIFFVVCSNNLGGCHGTTGPSSTDPRSEKGKPYGSAFPRFEVADQVNVQFALLDFLQIDTIHASIGSSLGGMQAVCAASLYSSRVKRFIAIATTSKSSASNIALFHVQRQAIMLDPNWRGGDYYGGALPSAGLALSRQIGTITFRSGAEWQARFAADRLKEPQGVQPEFKMESYLEHQGKKWVGRFDPNSMLWISKAADSFSMEAVGETGTLSLAAGLAKNQQPALVIGITHDLLYPIWQQKELADALRTAGNRQVVFYEIDSVYGHDAFLLDTVSVGPAIKGHLEQSYHRV